MTAVGDIIELSYGKALKAADRDGGPVPVVGSGGIVGGHSTGITDSPTIVVGRKGSIGSVTWVDGAAWPIDTAYYVKPRRDDLDRRWAFWMLKSLGLETMNKSAAIPGLTRDDVYRLRVTIPPLPEQRRIASILDHADTLRVKRQQVLAHLGYLIQSTFDCMFGDDLPLAPLGELAETRLGKMLDAKKQTGEHLRPYLRNANVQWFRFELGDLLEMDFTEKDRATLALMPGDVLVCEGGQPGRSAIWRGELEECYFQKALHRVRLGDDLEPEYFTRAMKKIVDSNGLKDYVTSSTIAHLTGEKLRTLPIPVPNLEQQREFERRAAQIRQQEDIVLRATATTNDLFASLHSRAFRGEL